MQHTQASLNLFPSCQKCVQLSLIIAVCSLAIGWASFASAQERELSVEELEAYIAEQRAALEQVIENREVTQQKAMEIQQAAEEQQSRQEELEEEIRGLCEEQELVQPGTLEGCIVDAAN